MQTPQDVPGIKIDVLKIHVSADGSTAACEILVIVNADTTLKVVDIIDYNSAGKITAVRAYNGTMVAG